MKTLHHLTRILFFSLCLSPLFAQTSEATLALAVQEYNAMREYSAGYEDVQSKKEDEDFLPTLRERREKGINLLEKVIKEGTAEQIKTARYFKCNFTYELAFQLGAVGKNSAAYDLMKAIKTEVDNYEESSFPLRYKLNDKNYSIKWTDYNPSKAEFYTGYAEIAHNLGKYSEASQTTKKALPLPYMTDYYRYILVNKMLEIHDKTKELTNDERLNYALQSIKAYDLLPKATQDAVEKNNFSTTQRGFNAMSQLYSSLKGTGKNGTWAAAADVVRKYNDANALKLYEMAFEDGYTTTDNTYLTNMLNTARQLNTSPIGKKIGTLALNELVKQTGNNDCEKLRTYATAYKQDFEDTKTAATLLEKAISCEKNRKEEQRKAEERRKKEEEDRKKRIYRQEHPFNVYIGVYPLHWFTALLSWDLGGQIDLVGKRNAHQFGYIKVADRKDFFTGSGGKIRWDGYKVQYAYKRLVRRQTAYQGLMLAYADKIFPEQIANVRNNDNNTNTRETFQNSEKQYELLYNSGFMLLTGAVGLDMFFGIGASYNQMSSNNTKYNNPNFTISDNEFLMERKPETFYPQARMGISVGLNLGGKRK